MSTSRIAATVLAAVGVTSLALAAPFVVPQTALRVALPAVVAPTPVEPLETTPVDPTTPVGTTTPVEPVETTVTDDLARGVVLVSVTTASGEGAGTGMVLTASGQVLTNYHVVEGSTAIDVTLASTGATYAAQVLGHDATADVALLQLEGASGLETVTLDDDGVQVGDAVTAVGNAEGGGELVAAAGTVPALEQTVTVSSGDSTETLAGVIETAAGAVPGDSGGPMFDAEGEVLGMTTAGGQEAATGGPGRRGGRGAVQVTSVSYAVPVADALAVVAQVRTGQDAGTVEVGPRAYLGVSIADDGLTVASVSHGTAAARAGITTGSQLTAIGGVTVRTRSGLAAELAGLEPGDRVEVAWVGADGVRHSATVELGASPVN